jgi:hypothetical protein
MKNIVDAGTSPAPMPVLMSMPSYVGVFLALFKGLFVGGCSHRGVRDENM